MSGVAEHLYCRIDMRTHFFLFSNVLSKLGDLMATSIWDDRKPDDSSHQRLDSGPETSQLQRACGQMGKRTWDALLQSPKSMRVDEIRRVARIVAENMCIR